MPVEQTVANTPSPTSVKIYRVKRYVDPAKLKADLAFSNLNLTDAMMSQASLFAHYGILAAQASKQVHDLELLIEATEASVYRNERDLAISNGEKPSDAGLKQIVSRNSKVKQLKRCLNEALQIEATAKIATESFRHRRDMLVQQGLLSREEMKG